MKAVYLLIPLLLVGCGSSIDPLEPPAELGTIVAPELEANSRWVRQVGKGSGQQYLKLAPLVDGERVFAVNYAGRIEAMDAASGERLWRTDLGVRINAGPGGAGDMLLFGGDAEVIALSKRDGSRLWSTPVSSEVLSIPQRSGDIVVAHSVDGNIIALNAETGERLWQHRESVPTLSLRGSSDPFMLNDAVLIGTASGKVVALALNDGRLIWEAVVAEPRGRTELERMVDVDAELAVADGVVYAASYQGNLAAIALASGRLLWNRDIGSSGAIVLDRDNLYLSDTNGDIWALSRRNGGTMWKQDDLHLRALTGPAQQGDYLIVGDFEGYLHWLAKADGSLVARSRINTWQEYWPVDEDHDGFTDFYREDRAVLLPPAVEGAQVFGMDKRGVLDAYLVTPVAREAE